ncbi:MAG: VCBS repeat-containing protein, partial [Planctomycetota bacterium]
MKLAAHTLAVALTPAAFAQFGSEQQLYQPTDRTPSLRFADLDGDGDRDLLFTVDPTGFNFPDRLVWAENLGGGAFGPEQVILDGFWAEGPRGTEAADLDGDGDLDVVFASTTNDQVSWFENLGGGTFGSRQIISSASNSAWGIAVVDIEGDGDIDVLSTEVDSDSVVLHENLGGGSFAPRQVIDANVDGASVVRAGDVDGDGDADVFAVATFGDEVGWYENLHPAGFGPKQLLFSYNNPLDDVTGPLGVELIDVDGDGDLDAFLLLRQAAVIGANIVWHENLGGGVFGPEQVVTIDALQPVGLAAEDLDLDGDVDLISTNRYRGSLAWYENLGGETFSEPRVIAEDVSPSGPVLVDMDGDGRRDVAVLLLESGRRLSWFRSQFDAVTRYCAPAALNSDDRAGTINAVGSDRAADLDLTLTASGLPVDVNGFFLAARASGFVPNPGGSDGDLCLGGPIGRLNTLAQIGNSGAS